jgi:hypothetical protein
MASGCVPFDHIKGFMRELRERAAFANWIEIRVRPEPLRLLEYPPDVRDGLPGGPERTVLTLARVVVGETRAVVLFD